MSDRRGYHFIILPRFEYGPARSVAGRFPFPFHRTVAEVDADEVEKRRRRIAR